LSHKLPFDLNIGGKNTFVYGSLGVILLVFLISGLFVIYKLTDSSGKKPDVADNAVVEQTKVTPAPPKAPVRAGDIPPPPDMYFD
jgi:hypothetical protein